MPHRCLALGLGCLLSALAGIAAPACARASAEKTPEELKGLFDAHQAEFDYLLGDWEFTAEHREYGKFRGYWSAVRLAEGAQILDEYRAVDDKGVTVDGSMTLRAYNPSADRWELITANQETGLQDFGTARRVGAEMHIEQKFGVMTKWPSIWRIRYYDIQPDRFSWTADVSSDEGRTWSAKEMQIQARRVGPPRTLGHLIPASK